MKISFGRIIPIKSVSSPCKNIQRKKVDKPTYEIAKVLNSEKSTVYSDSESKSIREFFQRITGDYNGKDGVLIKRTESGDTVLITGQDVQNIKNKGSFEYYLESGIENGKTRNKKDSEIVITSSKLKSEDLTPSQIYGKIPIKTKLDRFQYYSIQRHFSALVDGYIRNDIKHTQNATSINRRENITADYQELFLN